MRVLLWIHGGTFLQPDAAGEQEWLRVYAEAWEAQGIEVVRSHPLAEKLPPADAVHVFGSGRFETLSFLAARYPRLWLSPAPFTAPTVFPPIASARLERLRRWWRRIGGRSSLSGERDWVCLAQRIVVPAPLSFRSRSWPAAGPGTWLAVDSPAAAVASLRLDLFRGENA